jgi:hypothetical protein
MRMRAPEATHFVNDSRFRLVANIRNLCTRGLPDGSLT